MGVQWASHKDLHRFHTRCRSVLCAHICEVVCSSFILSFFLLTPLDASEKAMEATRLLCAARRACGRKNGEEDFIVTLIVHPFTTFTLSERISEIGKHTENCKLSPVIHTLGRGIYAPKEVSSRCWCARIRSERRRKNEVCKWY